MPHAIGAYRQKKLGSIKWIKDMINLWTTTTLVTLVLTIFFTELALWIFYHVPNYLTKLIK